MLEGPRRLWLPAWNVVSVLTTRGTLQDSRWVVGTLDVIPVEIALPPNISKRATDYPDDWQVFPLSLCTASRKHRMFTLPPWSTQAYKHIWKAALNTEWMGQLL